MDAKVGRKSGVQGERVWVERCVADPPPSLLPSLLRSLAAIAEASGLVPPPLPSSWMKLPASWLMKFPFRRVLTTLYPPMKSLPSPLSSTWQTPCVTIYTGIVVVLPLLPLPPPSSSVAAAAASVASVASPPAAAPSSAGNSGMAPSLLPVASTVSVVGGSVLSRTRNEPAGKWRVGRRL